jgi:hypothetical protein
MSRLILKEVLEGSIGTGVRPDSEDGLDPSICGDYIQKYMKSLKAHGIDADGAHMLGNGLLGTAFRLRNNTVLKITADMSEARAAKHIVGKKFKNVYNIFSVLQFSDEQAFALHQEYLEKGKVQQIETDYQMKSAFYDIKEDQRLNGDVSDERIKLMVTDAGLRKSQDQQLFYKFLKDIANGLKELRSVGIDFDDYHLGNILYRKSTSHYVLIDLGVSYSDAATIDELEPDQRDTTNT